MGINNINDGDTGLVARNIINEVVDQINKLGLDIQFSIDNDTLWHYPWVNGDLFMRLSADFGVTWTDGIYLAYSPSDSAGWTDAFFDETTGNLNFLKGAVLDETVNLDDRYALIADAAKSVFPISLPINGTLAGSIAAAVEGTDYPVGWVLTASSGNLLIEHNLGRYGADVTVSYNLSGTEYKFLRPFVDAFQGYTNLDDNNFRVETISTRYTQSILKLYIIIE
jgi:hypothetical protein